MTFSFLSAEDFDEQAHILYESGQYDEAMDLLKQGIARYPMHADLHVGLGYVRLAREEFVWAHRSFTEALAFDPDHEDAWVGRGETLLKFGREAEALRCFARVDELGLGGDLELGLAIGRALYREGHFARARDRLIALVAAHPGSAEAQAALGYALHALGDDLGARRSLRQALRMDPELHEVRIYLGHLLYEQGRLERALAELERVPASEHWDPLSLWRFIELKSSLQGCPEDDPSLAPWHARWAELRSEPDGLDHLLAEVEAAFEEGEVGAVAELAAHRVRTADGNLFVGTWEEIVVRMRDAMSDEDETVASFMQRAARRIRTLTGRDLPSDDAEAFLRESARIGLIRIEE